MKAFLLTAGLGTRLHPITIDTPKCLVPIGGRALIEWWFDSMERAGITEVLINLHHLPQQVRTHVEKMDTPIAVHFFMEDQLLGSAGTLRANKHFAEGEDSFFVIYGDNLTSLDLNALNHFHLSQQHPFTMALFRTNKPKSCGIAELDETGTVVSFIEKPENPVSNLANAGIYVASPAIFDLIPADKTPCDIGFDLLPKLVGHMSGWETDDYLIDIGTLENLEKARADWPSIKR